MAYGLKVSEVGFGVGTAADKDLVYSSEFNTFRVFASGGGTITLGTAAPTVLTLNHNMGTRPAFMFYSQIYDAVGGSVTSQYYLMPFTRNIGGDLGIMPYCSTASLTIRYGRVHAPNNTNLEYKYFIFYNPAR